MTDLPAPVTEVETSAGPRAPAAEVLRLLRTPHWVKSAIVFPVVVLAGQAGDAAAWVQALWSFIAFCLASSGVYALNDLLDRDLDRLHPLKCHRPIAAGRLTPPLALATALGAALGGLAVAVACCQPPAAWCVLIYLGLNLAYSLRLKHVPVVDAACVATGFVLRALALGGLPGGSLRGWSLCGSVFALCYFVAVTKRVADSLALGRAAAVGAERPNLMDGYTPNRLRRLSQVSRAATVLCYGVLVMTCGPQMPVAMLSALPVAYCLWRMGRLALGGVTVEQIDLVKADPGLIAGGLVWAALWAWIALG